MTKASRSKRLPTIFLGHGNPMNAIADNKFSRTLRLLGERIGKPESIVCVSAHWMTEGTWVTAMPKPKTIHDFYGFPEELFKVQYPASGNPNLASRLSQEITNPRIILDNDQWGLDHGTWSVLKHMYPEADVPVLQMSLYLTQPPEYHFELGEKLSKYRDEGVLIVGSGNIVHNLRRIKWEPDAAPYDWAVEFDRWAKEKIETRDFKPLMNEINSTESARLSIPTPEHYYPLLYVLGASMEGEPVRFEYEGIENGSISMRALSFGSS